jgi:hypothetical protein
LATQASASAPAADVAPASNADVVTIGAIGLLIGVAIAFMMRNRKRR